MPMLQSQKSRYNSYRKQWIHREKQLAEVQEEHRHSALREAERLAEFLARNFDVSKVVLYGSVIRPGNFDEHSDIDLAVENLAKERFFEALGRLIEMSRYPVDLKPVEEIRPTVLENIKKGIVLYET